MSYIGKLIRDGSEPDHPDDDAADPQNAFDRAWSAFIALDRKRQQEFLRSGIGYVGHAQGKTGGSVSGAPADLPHIVDRME